MNQLIKRSISVILAAVISLSCAALSYAAADKYDFSENNMTASCFISDGVNFDFSDGYGGNSGMSAAYLARWDGPVNESRDPFPDSGEEYDIKYKSLKPDYHVQNIEFIPERYDALDNASVKKALMNHGALYASFLVDDRCFNSSYTSYYLPASRFNYYLYGHAVAVVGWDDNYSKNNFPYKPQGNGAFLCKNSWDETDDNDGYFYISYYDSSLNVGDYCAAFYGVESTGNYDRIYQYDPLGPVDSLFSETDDLWIANVFPESGKTLAQDEKLCAASFYTDIKGVKYEIYAAENFKGKESLSSGKKVASGILNEAGYHTVKFDPLTVRKGTRFAVVVKLTNNNPNYMTGTYIECPLEDYSSRARANKNESFFSSDSRKWTDLTDEYKNSNNCIKAFTILSAPKSGSSADALALKDAVNNKTRKAHSNKVYTLKELASKGGNINSAYVDYVNSANKNSTVIPVPFTVRAVKNTENSTFPSKYDLRDYNCVTSVKDQKNTGTCWAFSTCASLESCMLKTDAGLTNLIGDRVSGVRANNISVRYKQYFSPDIIVDCDAGEDYYYELISSDESVVKTIGPDVLYSCGTGKANVEVIVHDYYGHSFKDTFTVESKYAFWQRLIRIFLFGFIWY